MKLPPDAEIIRHVTSMRVTREGCERIGRDIEAECHALAASRAYDVGSYSAGFRMEPTAVGARVVAEDPKSRWIEEGTGLYGPLRRRIVPVRGKVLVFELKSGAPSGSMSGKQRSDGLVFATSVAGRKASWVVRDASKIVAARYGLRFQNMRPFQG
jgi:hypothetical protein